MPRRRQSDNANGGHESKRRRAVSPVAESSISRRPQRMAKSVAIVMISGNSPPPNQRSSKGIHSPLERNSEFVDTPTASTSEETSMSLSKGSSLKTRRSSSKPKPAEKLVPQTKSANSNSGSSTPTRNCSPSTPHTTKPKVSHNSTQKRQPVSRKKPLPKATVSLEPTSTEAKKPLRVVGQQYKLPTNETKKNEDPSHAPLRPNIGLALSSPPLKADFFKSYITIRWKSHILGLSSDVVMDKQKLLEEFICQKKYEELSNGFKGICEMQKMTFLDGITIKGVYYSKTVMKTAARAIYQNLWPENDEVEKDHFVHIINMMTVRFMDFDAAEDPTILEKAIKLLEHNGGKKSEAAKNLKIEHQTLLKNMKKNKILTKSETILKSKKLQESLQGIQSSDEAEKLFEDFSSDVVPCAVAAYKGFYLFDLNQIDGDPKVNSLSNVEWL